MSGSYYSINYLFFNFNNYEKSPENGKNFFITLAEGHSATKIQQAVWEAVQEIEGVALETAAVNCPIGKIAIRLEGDRTVIETTSRVISQIEGVGWIEGVRSEVQGEITGPKTRH